MLRLTYLLTYFERADPHQQLSQVTLNNVDLPSEFSVSSDDEGK